MSQGHKIKWQCKTAPRFTAAHFAFLAELIRKWQVDCPTQINLAIYVANNLRYTNARFNPSAFLTACDPVAFAERQAKKRKTKKW